MPSLNFHWSYYILLVIISIALYTDTTKQKIYNKLTFPSLILGLIISFFNGVGILNSFIGFFIAFVISFVIYSTGGFKGGDVKLISSIGAWFGKSLIIPVILYIFIAGGLLGIVYTLKNGTFLKTFNKIKMFFIASFSPGMNALIEVRESVNKPVPYGVAIFAGVLVSLLYPDLINIFWSK